MLCNNSQTTFSVAGISYQNSFYGWKTMSYSVKKAGKRSLFETLAEISTLTHWIP